MQLTERKPLFTGPRRHTSPAQLAALENPASPHGLSSRAHVPSDWEKFPEEDRKEKAQLWKSAVRLMSSYEPQRKRRVWGPSNQTESSPRTPPCSSPAI